MSTYVIGIDIGTQGTKAALFNDEMELVANAFEESRLISPKPGTVWQEPDDLYTSCADTIRELLEKSGIAATDIAAIGLDGQMAGIMGVDADGKASTYYDSWLDMRCGKYVEQMNARAGKRIIALSGGPAPMCMALRSSGGKMSSPMLIKRLQNLFCPMRMWPAG